MAAAGSQSILSIWIALKQAKWRSEKKKVSLNIVISPCSDSSHTARAACTAGVRMQPVQSVWGELLLFPVIIIQLLLCLSFLTLLIPLFPCPHAAPEEGSN